MLRHFFIKWLQQHLPLAVLKRFELCSRPWYIVRWVATALTACGIETLLNANSVSTINAALQQHLPLAVLKLIIRCRIIMSMVRLQQHLPLAVLKLLHCSVVMMYLAQLQQHLPLAVLKQATQATTSGQMYRCNSTYRLRY